MERFWNIRSIPQGVSRTVKLGDKMSKDVGLNEIVNSPLYIGKL
jgi:hypothetical protein